MKKPVVGVAVGQDHGAVIRTQQRRRIPRTVIVGVAHDFSAKLVVTHLAENVAIAKRDEVIELIDPTVAGKGQNALFGEQIVELKLAQLDV